MTTDIAFYHVKLNYLEPRAEEENLKIPTGKLKEFFDLLPKGQMYWVKNDEQNSSMGFWTDWNKLKKVEVFEIKGELHDDRERSADEISEDSRNA